MKKIFRKITSFAEEFQMKKDLKNKVPVQFSFKGKKYYVNPDKSAIYHIKHSTQKIANMVDLIPSDTDMIFDVGGNCGLFSAFAEVSCPNASIHCFEPSPSLLPIIRRNVSQTRVKIYEAAVGDCNDKLDFFINKESEQTNSFNRNAVELFAQPNYIETLSVDCITLDHFAATNHINKIDVLKVDVQGFEGAVFRGARSLLPSVKMLFVESTWIDLESIVEMIPFALEYGFTHASIVNPVHMGADILLTRHKIKSPIIKMAFEVNQDLLVRRWK